MGFFEGRGKTVELIGIALTGAGFATLLVSSYLWFRWDSVRNSELFKMGFSLRSWLTGIGMQDSHGGTLRTTRGRAEEVVDGVRRVRETVNLSTDPI